MKIAVIDYGVGNLYSLGCSLAEIGAVASVTSDAKIIRDAAGLILPGVGAFRDAREKLDATGLIPVIRERVKAGVPLLGICLGMQMLFDESHEYGIYPGLGFIGGSVVPIGDYIKESVKIPHMGWNSLDMNPLNQSRLLKNTAPGEYVYYVHSYFAKCKNPTDISATSFYGGIDICGAVENGNVFGTQFHPEKSGKSGLTILKTYAEICEKD